MCCQTYAWRVLSTLFTEVLTRDEWLCLMDNVLSNHPALLLVCVVAYCVVGRTALLRCTEHNDFEVSRPVSPPRYCRVSADLATSGKVVDREF